MHHPCTSYHQHAPASSHRSLQPLTRRAPTGQQAPAAVYAAASTTQQQPAQQHTSRHGLSKHSHCCALGCVPEQTSRRTDTAVNSATGCASTLRGLRQASRPDVQVLMQGDATGAVGLQYKLVGRLGPASSRCETARQVLMCGVRRRTGARQTVTLDQPVMETSGGWMGPSAQVSATMSTAQTKQGCKCYASARSSRPEADVRAYSAHRC